MKMFLVVYENFLDEGTTNAFKQAGYKSYTKMHNVIGEGEKHLPKLGNRVWPGKKQYPFVRCARRGDSSTYRGRAGLKGTISYCRLSSVYFST